MKKTGRIDTQHATRQAAFQVHYTQRHSTTRTGLQPLANCASGQRQLVRQCDCKVRLRLPGESVNAGRESGCTDLRAHCWRGGATGQSTWHACARQRRSPRPAWPHSAPGRPAPRHGSPPRCAPAPAAARSSFSGVDALKLESVSEMSARGCGMVHRGSDISHLAVGIATSIRMKGGGAPGG